MDNLPALRCLLAALDKGSLSAAARHLGVTQPAVSQQIASLEAELGQTLLVRTRSGVRPTEAGLIVQKHGAEIVATISRMEDGLAALSGEVAGPLRVTTNLLMSQTVLVPVMTELRHAYPRLKIELVATDDLLDLVEEKIDVALRAGRLGNGPGRAMRIATLDGTLVASPRYLDRVGRPKTIDDLAGLDFIQYRDDPSHQVLKLKVDGGTVEAPVTTAFAAQMPNLVLHAVTNDFGFAHAPRFLVEPMLADGTLEEVLPAFSPEPKNVYLVLQQHSADSRRVQVFLSRLLSELAKIGGVNLTSEARNRAGAMAA